MTVAMVMTFVVTTRSLFAARRTKAEVGWVHAIASDVVTDLTDDTGNSSTT